MRSQYIGYVCVCVLAGDLAMVYHDEDDNEDDDSINHMKCERKTLTALPLHNVYMLLSVAMESPAHKHMHSESDSQRHNPF